jgi:sugar lactone lactonase YvrE
MAAPAPGSTAAAAGGTPVPVAGLTFAGISADQQSAAIPADLGIEPPNPQIAAGPSSLLEMVNSTGAVYNKSGALLTGPFDLNLFFGVPSGYTFSDANLFYDSSASRFFALGMAFDSLGSSRIYLATSQSSDPRGSWWVYQVAGTPAYLVMDRAKVSTSNDKVMVMWDEYDCSSVPCPFRAAEGRVIEKTQLVAGSAGPATMPYLAAASASGLVPAIELSSDAAIYLAYVLTTDVRLVTITGTPAARNVVVAEQGYTVAALAPVDAPAIAQPDGGPLLYPVRRLQSAVWQNGETWAVRTIGCTPQGETAMRACINVIHIAPGGSAWSGNLGVPGSSLLDPAISVDSAGRALILANQMGIHQYPRTVAIQTAPIYQTVAPSAVVLAPGLVSYDSTACQGASIWADYSGIGRDPTDPTEIWAVGEYMPVAGKPCNWGTAISAIRSSPPPVLTTINPTGGPAAGGTTADLTGSGFTGTTGVTFNGIPGSFTVLSDTHIQVVTPPLRDTGTTSYSYCVVVTTPGGATSTNVCSGPTFTYQIPPPVVSGVSPTSGSSAGGTIVTVSGTGLTMANAVSFVQSDAFGPAITVLPANFISRTDTRIVVAAPGYAAGPVHVVVWSMGIASTTGAADQFTYVAPSSPAPGSFWQFAGGLGTGPATNIGQTPVAVLAVGSQVYITDSGFSPAMTQAIRSLDASTANESILAGGFGGFKGDGGPATQAGFSTPGAMARDSSGNLYVVDANRVRRITPAGVISTYAGTGLSGRGGDGGPAVNAQLAQPGGLAVDAAGNLYIADTLNGSIRKVSASTGIISTLTASLTKPEALAFDGAGNLYATDVGYNNNFIYRVDSPGNPTRIAGNGFSSYSGDGGPATAAGLAPWAIAFDTAGNLYVADKDNHRIRKIDTSAQRIITTVAGNGIGGFAGDGSAATSAEINSPSGVTVDAANVLYIADTANFRVRKVAAGTITTVAGTGLACGFQSDGGAATAVQLCGSEGVATDGAGNVFIADSGANRIRKVAPNGTITTVAGTGVAGYSGDSGPATLAQLSKPKRVAFSAGNLYIADTGNQAIRKVDGTGTITTVVAPGTLSAPQGLAVDAAGNLYIADAGNNQVRKLAGAVLTVVAGTGVAGSLGDGGPATQAQLNHPMGLAIDGVGRLYVADTVNALVRRISSNGLIDTIAGKGGPYSGDQGPALTARLYYPSDVALRANGDLVIADQSGVREVLPSGIIDTVIGEGNLIAGFGEPALSAQATDSSAALATDSAGNLFLGHPTSSRVFREVPPVPAGAPMIASLVADVGSVTLSWQLPSDGGSPVTSFTITPYIGTAAQTPTVVTGSFTPNGFELPPPVTATVSGLRHATYTFQVAATTPAGVGAAATSGAVTILTPPGPPSAVHATPGHRTATVSWTPPAEDGGSPVTEYTVTASPGGVQAGTEGGTTTTVRALTDGVTYTFTVEAINAQGIGAPSGASHAATPFDGGSYHSLPPARILDTRDGTGSTGTGPVPRARIGPGQTLTVQVTGQGSVPMSGVSAVVVNATVTNTTAASYLTIYPTGLSRPVVSSLNWVAGQTVPNLVEVAVGQGGQLTIFNPGGSVDVIFDVQGWVGVTENSQGADGLYNPLTPSRILDTRTGNGTNGIIQPLGPGAVLALQVANRGGVDPASVSAVVLNVTVADPTAASYLTIYPSDAARPLASNLNFVPGQTVPNRVIVKLGADGAVKIFNSAGSVNVIADVGGWFTGAASTKGGSHFVALAPRRLADTRYAAQPLGPGETRPFQISGANGVAALVLNVTATNPTVASYLTLWPAGDGQPVASDLNFIPNQTVPNFVVAKLGVNSTIDVFNAGGFVDVVTDLVGYYGVVVPAPSAIQIRGLPSGVGSKTAEVPGGSRHAGL